MLQKAYLENSLPPMKATTCAASMHDPVSQHVLAGIGPRQALWAGVRPVRPCRQARGALTSGLSATSCWYVTELFAVWPMSATTPSLHPEARLCK